MQQAFLFYDPASTPREAVDAAIAECEPWVGPIRAINFFSSNIEDLQLVSKYRIVSLPTFLIAVGKTVVHRLTERLPTDRDLIYLEHP